MGSPRHLWTGEWRAESDQARDGADGGPLRTPRQPSAEPAPDTPPPSPPARRRGGTWVLGTLVVLLAIVAGALAATMLLDDGADTVEPLPAVDSRPLRPREGQTRTGAIYAKAGPAVVSIRTQTGSGTGFLIDDDGTIVTNAHVVGTSSHVVVRFGQDGASIDGDLLGRDESTDLAVVSIDPDRIPKGVDPLRFADSRGVQVGDVAIAIGNPFGLDRTATEGIVSGLGRSIQAPNGFEIDEIIQTDAPINPGNSGGPLLDDGGRVIGVNSQIATAAGGAIAGQGGNIGIGFAVPSNTAREIVPLLARGESIPRPYLGVTTAPTSLTAPSAGAQVQRIEPNSPADRAGLRVGDVVKSVAGRGVQDPRDVAAGISDRKPGDEVEIRVERDGRSVTLDVTLGTRPERMP
jgi:putative serine protease PepD